MLVLGIPRRVANEGFAGTRRHLHCPQRHEVRHEVGHGVTSVGDEHGAVAHNSRSELAASRLNGAERGSWGPPSAWSRPWPWPCESGIDIGAVRVVRVVRCAILVLALSGSSPRHTSAPATRMTTTINLICNFTLQ